MKMQGLDHVALSLSSPVRELGMAIDGYLLAKRKRFRPLRSGKPCRRPALKLGNQPPRLSPRHRDNEGLKSRAFVLLHQADSGVSNLRMLQ